MLIEEDHRAMKTKMSRDLVLQPGGSDEIHKAIEEGWCRSVSLGKPLPMVFDLFAIMVLLWSMKLFVQIIRTCHKDCIRLHCSECSKLFSDGRTKISKCSACEFFIMCEECKAERKHGHHLNRLQIFSCERLKTTLLAEL